MRMRMLLSSPSLGLLACTSNLLLHSLARAQDSSASAALTSVQPAATSITSLHQPESPVPWFEDETIQLTDEALKSALADQSLAQYVDLFDFDRDNNSDARKPRSDSDDCKLLPGDGAWPRDFVWRLFDRLLGGALLDITPIAAPCYPDSVYDNYDAARCDTVVSEWTTAELHTSDPGSAMFPVYEGRTCMPTVDPVGTCTQGGYSSYAVNVSNVAQIQLALNFARETNVRLVIRNTGHDYNGRSTGAGGLSVWMHHLNDITFVPDYEDPEYQGPAMKVGAGVQAFEVYEAAHEYGVTVLSGICPSVGFAGGYLAGGGHSPLMQIYGMAADQILALEAVTADGQFVTATSSHHSDLFWALGGGGGGTFGIVTSVVVKAYPKMPVTTSMISFNTSAVSADTFWEGFRAFWDLFIPFNDAQTYSYFWIYAGANESYTFNMTPFYAPNHTIESFQEVVKPWFDRLDELGIPFTADTKHHDDFLSSYDSTFGALQWGIGASGGVPGVRFLPRANWESDERRDATFNVVRDIVNVSGMIGGYHQAPNNPDKILNSVNPAFRTEASFLIVGSIVDAENPTADDYREAAQTLLDDIINPLREVAPDGEGGGAYLNEAAVNEPNWQVSFWGDNYPRLLELKGRWDPRDVFYVHHGVGSENWEVRDGDQGVQTQNGRLCRV